MSQNWKTFIHIYAKKKQEKITFATDNFNCLVLIVGNICVFILNQVGSKSKHWKPNNLILLINLASGKTLRTGRTIP